MCGIAGVAGTQAALDLTGVMTQCLAHRGRDDHASAEVRDASGALVGALGHRRLSILDLSLLGHQPMASRDGRMVIVFNGEVYNFRELRDDLRGRGHVFNSDSDTEVILAGWREYGRRFVRSMRGMFAFALWDRDASELSLARDPFGIKPLYIVRRAGTVAFASEIRALLAAGVAPRRISAEAVHAYLSLGSIPDPLVAVGGIQTLAPGSVLTLRFEKGIVVGEENAVMASALEPSGAVPERDMRAASSIVREALRDSVAHHLVSDVPVGLFLSGGVDSSAVVALATEASGARLDTFTVVFEEARFSEAAPARTVAERYKTRHREIQLSGRDFLAALPDAFAAMDQPSLDGLNTYVVSKAVHDAGLKVVLSGLGGDELFGGYASFRRAWSARGLWRGTGWAREPLAQLASASRDGRANKLALLLHSDDLALGAYRASRALFAGRGLAALAGNGAAVPPVPPPPGLTLLQRVSWYEITGYMRSVLLRDSDVFSMAHHLELRVPFVDRAVAAASLRIDDALKMRGGGKAVLVEAVRDLLPATVWDRPKQGFTLPFADWLRGPLAGEIANALQSGRRLERLGLRPAATNAVWSDFLRGAVSWSRPWALYTLVRWAETLDVSLSGSGLERHVA